MTWLDQEGVDKESFPDGKLHTLVIVNIGKPGENSWFDRLPRLDYDEVATTIRDSAGTRGGLLSAPPALLVPADWARDRDRYWPGGCDRMRLKARLNA
jgi:hypothetical protein